MKFKSHLLHIALLSALGAGLGAVPGSSSIANPAPPGVQPSSPPEKSTLAPPAPPPPPTCGNDEQLVPDKIVDGVPTFKCEKKPAPPSPPEPSTPGMPQPVGPGGGLQPPVGPEPPGKPPQPARPEGDSGHGSSDTGGTAQQQNACSQAASNECPKIDITNGNSSTFNKEQQVPGGVANTIHDGGTATFSGNGQLNVVNNAGLLVETGANLDVDINNATISSATSAGKEAAGVYYLEPGVNIDLAKDVTTMPQFKASDINLTTHGDVTINSSSTARLTSEHDHTDITQVMSENKPLFPEANTPENFLLNRWEIKEGTGTLHLKKDILGRALATSQQTTEGRNSTDLPPPGVIVASGATFVTHVDDTADADGQRVDMKNLVSGEGTWDVNTGHFTATSVPSNVKVDDNASLNVTSDKALNTTLSTEGKGSIANVTLNEPAPAEGKSAENSNLTIGANAGTTNVNVNANNATVNVNGNGGDLNLNLTGQDGAPITTNVVMSDSISKEFNYSLNHAIAAVSSNSKLLRLGNIDAKNDATLEVTNTAPDASGVVVVDNVTGQLGMKMKIDADQTPEQRLHSAQVFVLKGTPGTSSSTPASTPAAQTGSIVLKYTDVQNPEGLVGKHLRVGVTDLATSIVLKQSADTPLVVDGKKYKVVLKSEPYKSDDSGVNVGYDNEYLTGDAADRAAKYRSWYLEAVAEDATPAVTLPTEPILTPEGQLKAFAYANSQLLNDLPLLVNHYVAPVKGGTVTTWVEASGSFTKSGMFVDTTAYKTKTYRYGVELGVDKAFVRDNSVYRIGLLGQFDQGKTEFGDKSTFTLRQWNVGAYLSYANPNGYLGVSARYVSALSKSDQTMDFKAKAHAVRVNLEAGVVLNWIPNMHLQAVPHVQYQYTRNLAQTTKGTYLGQAMVLDMKASNVHKVRVGIDLTKDLFMFNSPSRAYVGFDYIYKNGLDHAFTANGKSLSLLPETHSVRFSAGVKVFFTDSFALDLQLRDNISLGGYANTKLDGTLGMSYEF